MATGLASAATHNLPLMTLPPIPRVRPPRIPKGTPQGNTLPQPEQPVPEGKVWADGRWRAINSNSAKHKRAVQSRQVEKALRHETHGMNIYAYSHIRTNQVVYSLTRVMDNNKILPQLLYHGKKMVPAALRRDLWRPYFSIHFPQTPAGAAKGLRVYQDLRELALRRQLSPPRDLILTTEEDVEKIKRKFDPIELDQKLEAEGKDKLILPTPGEILPKRLRAVRLMNQKASSVADLAAVLAYQDLKKAPTQWLLESEKDLESREDHLSKKAKSRLNSIRKIEATTGNKVEVRQSLVDDSNSGQVGLTVEAAKRLSIEYEGAMNASGTRVEDLQVLSKAAAESAKAIRPRVELEALTDEILKEKNAKRVELLRRLSAAHDAIPETERKLADEQIAKDRAKFEAEIEDRRTHGDQMLREQRQKLRETIDTYTERMKAGSPSQKVQIRKQRTRARGELRKLQREGSMKLLVMIEKEKQKLKYIGYNIDLRDELAQALEEINLKWQPKLDELQAQQSSPQQNEKLVEIRWADIRSATYAQEWPGTVFHENLQPKTAVKKAVNSVKQRAHLDETEHEISEQRAPSKAQVASSVHVFGGVLDEESQSGWWETPEQLTTAASKARSEREQEWQITEQILARREILRLRELTRKLALVQEVDEYSKNNADYAESTQDTIAAESVDTASETTQAGLDEALSQLSAAREILDKIQSDAEKPEVEVEGQSEFDMLIDQAKQTLATVGPRTLTDEQRRVRSYAQALIRQLEFEYQFIDARGVANRYEDFLAIWEGTGTGQNTPQSEDVPTSVSDLYHDRKAGPLNGPGRSAVEEVKDRVESLHQAISAREQQISELREQLITASAPHHDGVSAEPNSENSVILELQDQLKELEVANADDEMEIADSQRAAWIAFRDAEGIPVLGATSISGVGGSDLVSSATGSAGSQSAKSRAAKLRELRNLPGNVEIPSEAQPRQGLWARLRGLFGGK